MFTVKTTEDEEEAEEVCCEDGLEGRISRLSNASKLNILERPITINVSGLRYEIRKSTLDQFPDTLLGSSDKEFYYDIERKEYFFERHRPSFDTVIYYYQSGGLINVPAWLNPEILAAELKFFRIGNEAMSSRLTGRDILQNLMVVNQNVIAPKDPLKKKLWLTFSDPESSTLARYVHYFDTIVIMVAIAAQCIETLPEFDHLKNIDEGLLRGDTNQDWDVWLCFMIEVMCITWFTVDFIIRLSLCPNKREFVTGVMNWIDFLSILPFYLNIVFNYSYTKNVDPMDTETKSSKVDALMILRITRLLRVLRVARIFKMSRRFDGLFALGYALKAGAPELTLLVVLLTTCVILFSSLVYFANESDPENSPFSSVIDAFWWSVVTMSTVGYGDQVPTTFLGKVVGVVTALTGILVIALPYPIIVTRFNKYYELQKRIKNSAISIFDDDGEDQEVSQPTFDGVIFRGNKDAFTIRDNEGEKENHQLQYFCEIGN